MINRLPARRQSEEEREAQAASLSGTRSQMIQRLQVGLFGLVAMIMIVGLAQIVIDRLRLTEASTVPEAAATLPAKQRPVARKDPLVEAGVVPDIPVAPSPAPTITPSPVQPLEGSDAISQARP